MTNSMSHYSKSPLDPFPKAVYDVAAIAITVLAGDELPIDKSKVIINVFSAGGNLVLAAGQLSGLKGIVRAALTFYPIVEWSVTQAEKLAMRPYNNGPKDCLAEASYWFDWAYVAAEQNRRDPLFIPFYANKEDLPKWIHIIGAESLICYDSKLRYVLSKTLCTHFRADNNSSELYSSLFHSTHLERNGKDANFNNRA